MTHPLFTLLLIAGQPEPEVPPAPAVEPAPVVEPAAPLVVTPGVIVDLSRGVVQVPGLTIRLPPAPTAAPLHGKGGVVIDGRANGVGRTLVIENSRQGFNNTIVVEEDGVRRVFGGKCYPLGRQPVWDERRFDDALGCWLYLCKADAAWFRFDRVKQAYRFHEAVAECDADDDWDD